MSQEWFGLGGSVAAVSHGRWPSASHSDSLLPLAFAQVKPLRESEPESHVTACSAAAARSCSIILSPSCLLSSLKPSANHAESV
eukprot:15095329-Alexandrium_andersonii.AAC.1